MITLPKPRFAETNVPIGLSPEEKADYHEKVIDQQTHILGDAIDRVSQILRYSASEI